MKRGISFGVFVLAAASLLVGLPALAGQTPAPVKAEQGLRAGLNRQALAIAGQKAAAEPHQVTMAAQTTIPLLKQATRVGPHAQNATIELTLGLQLRHRDRLQWFLRRVQNPDSPIYRQFLTPEQFTAEYGPSQAQVAAVVQFLKRWGIEVKAVAPNRLLIHTEAPTRRYEQAFGIRINDYRLNGREFFSTMDRPHLPRDLGSIVTNVIGLNNAVQMHSHLHVKSAGPRVRAHPNEQAPPPATSAYYNPLQIATAYDWPEITNPDNGSGVRVAILTAESSGLSADDYEGFWDAFGLPDHEVNVIPVDGDKGITDGMLETLLDTEWAGAMGPGATLDVYVAADVRTATFTDMYNRFANATNPDGSAKYQVMTTSWGQPGGPPVWPGSLWDNIFLQAASEGISMFAAAGDAGSGDGAGTIVADYPSVSPEITAANGTVLHADADGNYISETAWSGTGGAVSDFFIEPPWQRGPGVPDNGWRNNSDMAMNAGQQRPYLILYQGNWYEVYGTSAVAPQFAGLFAIGVWKNGGQSLGLSPKLIYDDVNAGNYASDFRDVTTGSNGAFNAGPNWDHPTGWGSPRATSLLSHLGMQGPAGNVTGTVTDAASGLPIGDATISVTPGNYPGKSRQDGHYALHLPVGDYTVKVADFGYEADSATVTVADGDTVKHDFTLQSAPTAKLTGKITDGSGHGYPLYAEIVVSTAEFGAVADVWNDPTTGQYSVTLPKGYDYTLAVTAAFNGYQKGTATVELDRDRSQNLALTVANVCTAPGYGFVKGFNEDFNGDFPPAGWSIVNAVDGSPVVWKTSEAWSDDNWTGGTGLAADSDSGKAFPYSGPHDTSIVTPPIAVSSLPPQPRLKYKANFGAFMVPGNDSLDLDISVDGGAFTNILHWAKGHGQLKGLPGEDVDISLAPYIPSGAKQIRLRWRNYDLSSNYAADFYAQIDDVLIGQCLPIAGGLVFGKVTDGNNGDAIVGATIKDDKNDAGKSLANASDPDFPPAAYLMFVPSGKRHLTASDVGYKNAGFDFTMTDGAVKTHDFVLDAGIFSGDPGQFTLHVMVNNRQTEQLTINNPGSTAARFRIFAINSPPAASAARAMGPFAPAPQYAPDKDLSAPFAHPVDKLAGKAGREAGGFRPAGNVVSAFSTGIRIYGLGFDRNAGDLWLGSPSYSGLGGDDQDHRFLTDGTNTGDAINTLDIQGLYMADAAFDDNTGMLWQLSIESKGGIASTSHIWELDPETLQATGKKIAVPSPQSERGLAYDPLGNTWYAGDFNSGTIYHFNAKGDLLDSANVDLPIAGLAYNSATGHLFVLNSGGDQAIYVLDTRNDYAVVRSFNINGFDSINSGAGLGYDCNGHLWVSDYTQNVVLEVKSGEVGWCAFKGIPWLSLTPAAATVGSGAAQTVELTFDGTGQQEFTTSKAQLKLGGNTPYTPQTVPLTVTWDPQPVDLALTGTANADAVQKGGGLIYTLTIKNAAADNHGAATQTELTYRLPEGVSYASAGGDGVSCAAPSAGSSSMPAAATGGVPDTVVCDLGKLAQGASKTVTIAVQTNEAGKLTSHFEVTAREPDDADKNSLDVTTTVIGKADLGASAENATLTQGSAGTLHLAVANAGPDPATDVKLKLSAGSDVKLQSAKSGQGSCTVSGGGIECDLGEIAAGRHAAVTVTAFGIAAGSAQVTVQATTTADDADSGNNVATAQVTVKAPSTGGGNDNGGGGGALGWLALVMLFGFALSAMSMRYRSRRRFVNSINNRRPREGGGPV